MKPPEHRPSPHRSTVAGLVVIVVVAALLFWVAQAISAHNRLQDCLDSGRRSCRIVPGTE